MLCKKLVSKTKKIQMKKVSILLLTISIFIGSLVSIPPFFKLVSKKREKNPK